MAGYGTARMHEPPLNGEKRLLLLGFPNGLAKTIPLKRRPKQEALAYEAGC